MVLCVKRRTEVFRPDGTSRLLVDDLKEDFKEDLEEDLLLLLLLFKKDSHESSFNLKKFQPQS